MSESDPTTNLSFVTTDELITELAIRSDTMVIGSIPKTHPSRVEFRYSGRYATALGLITLLRRDIIAEYEKLP